MSIPRLGPTMEWDTGAAHAIALESGRKVLADGTGLPLVYNKENLLNPLLFRRVIMMRLARSASFRMLPPRCDRTAKACRRPLSRPSRFRQAAGCATVGNSQRASPSPESTDLSREPIGTTSSTPRLNTTKGHSGRSHGFPGREKLSQECSDRSSTT